MLRYMLALFAVELVMAWAKNGSFQISIVSTICAAHRLMCSMAVSNRLLAWR
jgi:hypothetical protein